MRVCGYRELLSYKGVTVAEKGYANLEIEKALRFNFGSLESYPPPGVMSAFNLPGNLCQVSTESERCAYVLDGNGKELAFRGAIFYDSLSELVGFLMENYLPKDPSYDLDRLVKDLQRGGTSEAKVELETFILRGQDNRAYRSRRRRFIPMQSVRSSERSPRFICYSNHAERAGDLWTDLPQGRFAFLQVGEEIEEQPFVAFEDTIKLRGHSIPRLAFVSSSRDWDLKSDDACRTGVLVFDGRRFTLAGGGAHLPKELLQRFEKEGTLYSRLEFDCMPSAHLRARCVVRIPGRKELEKELGRDVKKRRPRNPDLLTPAFLRDSREPILIGEGTPVVDSTASAAYVLNHTVRGIYMPGQVLRPFPPDMVPAEPTYVVLCEPWGMT